MIQQDTPESKQNCYLFIFNLQAKCFLYYSHLLYNFGILHCFISSLIFYFPLTYSFLCADLPYIKWILLSKNLFVSMFFHFPIFIIFVLLADRILMFRTLFFQFFQFNNFDSKFKIQDFRLIFEFLWIPIPIKNLKKIL